MQSVTAATGHHNPTDSFNNPNNSRMSLEYEIEDENESMLFAMLKQDEEYLSAPMSPSELPHWRRKICDWSYRVIDHFGYERDVVYIAMNTFDRYVCGELVHLQRKGAGTGTVLSTQTLQLCAMTCLYLSIKINATASSMYDQQQRPRRLRLSSFVELSRGQFTEQDIEEMEVSVLSKLQWRVNPVAPSSFVPLFLRYLTPPTPWDSFNNDCAANNYLLAMHVIQELARYLCELSVCLDLGSSSKPFGASDIAYNSILVAFETLKTRALTLEQREVFCSTIYQRCNLKAPNSELMQILRDAICFETLLEEHTSAANQQHPLSLALQANILVLPDSFLHHRRDPSPPVRNFSPRSTNTLNEGGANTNNRTGTSSHCYGVVTP